MQLIKDKWKCTSIGDSICKNDEGYYYSASSKNILPSLVNEFITLNKETAVVTVISALDIMRRAYIVGGSTYRYLEPLLLQGNLLHHDACFNVPW